MKQNYNSVNATFGSSALDLSTLPAYRNEYTQHRASIISFEEVAPRTRVYKKESILQKFFGFIDYVCNYIKNYSLLEPFFSGKKAQLPTGRATRKQSAILLCGLTAAFVGLSILGM